MKKSKAVFYEYIEEPDGNVETFTLTQNLEAERGDHFKVEISLGRWRTKDMLVKYLRTIADVIEKHPINGLNVIP